MFSAEGKINKKELKGAFNDLMRLVMACAVSQCSLHSFNFSDYTSGMHWRVNLSETLFSCLFVYRCILGLLKPKICVLVTHQLQFLKEATSILCLKEVSTEKYVMQR